MRGRWVRVVVTRVSTARATEGEVGGHESRVGEGGGGKGLGGGEAEERRSESGGDRRGGKREAMMLDSRPLRRVVAHAGWRTFYGRASALWA